MNVNYIGTVSFLVFIFSSLPIHPFITCLYFPPKVSHFPQVLPLGTVSFSLTSLYTHIVS